MNRRTHRAGRPRLLYLGHNLPFPPVEGALIRSYHTVRLLSRTFDVSAIYFFRRGAHASEEARRVALRELKRFGPATVHPISQEFSRTRFAWDHVRSLLTRTPYTRWSYESEDVRTRLSEEFGGDGFDMIHVDSLDLMAYLPAFVSSRMPVVLAHHNVESSLLRRRAEPERRLKRAYIKHQANLVARAEREWAPRVALNVTVSEDDAALLNQIAPEAEVFVVPNGVDTTAFAPNEKEPQGGIVFVGGTLGFRTLMEWDFSVVRFCRS
ncbi:MAG: glycosyltransferase [Dehalococcoidia bacterium]